MKREDKNAQSRQKILDGALAEFSAKGYGGASLNAVCAENGLSKGIIYHYFKDKDELYLLCVSACFDALTARLEMAAGSLSGGAEERLRAYFDARLAFFADHPLFLGIFTGVVLDPPAHLSQALGQCRRGFDDLNTAVLASLLEGEPLRAGLTIPTVTEDFRLYQDFFNARFRAAKRGDASPGQVLKAHEEQCHRQVDLLLHGILEEQHG